MRLENKIAIITGSSQGIGAETARRFAREGAAVVLAARRREVLDDLAAEIADAGGRALAVSCDVSDEASVENLLEQTVAQFGRLDILVNIAVQIEPGMLEDHDTPGWRNNFNVTLDGTMFVMRAASEQLLANGGSVVNVASVCALQGTPAMSAYSAAKAGVIALSRNAAIEWAARGVRVNTVIPGVFLTPPTQGMLPDNDAEAAMARSVPIQRIGDPAECASAILFLASDEASYITGTELIVDGGRTAELKTG